MIIVIEHLEEKLTSWVYFEYKHIAEVLRNKLVITNIKNKEEKKRLEPIAKVYEQSIVELYKNKKIIVLDPEARQQLRPEDNTLANIVVIGGIMGDYPPRKRTRKLLTNRIRNAIPRHIGDGQYSVDGAAMIAYLVLEKKIPLEKIEYKDGITITRKKYGITQEIHLPYRYPVINGKLFFSKDLEELLVKGLEYEENLILRE